MNEYICGDFFGEKPHRDGALAESRWGLNSYNSCTTKKQLPIPGQPPDLHYITHRAYDIQNPFQRFSYESLFQSFLSLFHCLQAQRMYVRKGADQARRRSGSSQRHACKYYRTAGAVCGRYIQPLNICISSNARWRLTNIFINHTLIHYETFPRISRVNGQIHRSYHSMLPACLQYTELPPPSNAASYMPAATYGFPPPA